MSAFPAEAASPVTRLRLLGPQRTAPTVAEALRSLGVTADAPIATIAAGWQEREDDDLELHGQLGGSIVNLGLYRRAERVFERDPELAHAVHERQATLRQLQALYRVRLAHAMDACCELLRREGEELLLREERLAAVETVRALDGRHLARVGEIHEAFESRWGPHDREAVAREGSEVERLLADTAVVAVAGGHIAVLLNRLRLFHVAPLLAGRKVVAWSAGAMALAETVVLFHDRPPHGSGYPEVLERGLALAPGVVPLPHARRRLDLDDPLRVLVAARRFAPASCVPMDEGARLDWDGARWRLPAGARRLGIAGAIDAWAAA